jgi:hypothetical protein
MFNGQPSWKTSFVGALGESAWNEKYVPASLPFSLPLSISLNLSEHFTLKPDRLYGIHSTFRDTLVWCCQITLKVIQSCFTWYLPDISHKLLGNHGYFALKNIQYIGNHRIRNLK